MSRYSEMLPFASLRCLILTGSFSFCSFLGLPIFVYFLLLVFAFYGTKMCSFSNKVINEISKPRNKRVTKNTIKSIINISQKKAFTTTQCIDGQQNKVSLLGFI